MPCTHIVPNIEHTVSKYLLSELKTKYFSTQVILPDKGMCDNGQRETVWAVTISIWWVKVRNAIKHLIMYRTKNYLAPEVKSAEVEEICP